MPKLNRMMPDDNAIFNFRHVFNDLQNPLGIIAVLGSYRNFMSGNRLMPR
jgi:hypothetical protein